MALTCYIYDDFVKVRNSTKRPDPNGNEEGKFWLTSVTIKDESDVYSPVLLIDTSEEGALFRTSQCNYLYLSNFNKYYWVEHLVWFQGFWELHCIEDCLATYKNSFINDYYYVERTNNAAYINPKLIDAMFPADNNVTVNESATRMPTTPDGTYIVGIIGGGSILSKV